MGERSRWALPPTGRNSVKSRKGCVRCKQRRIKCDEKVPTCGPCSKKGYRCPGPNNSIRWSQKHQPTTWMGQGRASDSQNMSKQPSLHPFTRQPFDSTKNDAHNTSDEGGAADLPYSSTYVGDKFSVCLAHQTSLSSLPLLSPETLADFESHQSILTDYYFSSICPINSCFDTYYNPLRSYVGTMMFSCPLLFQCVMSMSAAHLSQKSPDMIHVALSYRKQAVASLTSQLSLCTVAGTDSTLLLGSILLGMTSSWHNVSSVDVVFLRTARIMVKEFMVQQQHSNPKDQPGVHPTGTFSFIFGLLAYWEAMVSFIFDQRLEELNYLLLHDEQNDHLICPNPWTGVSNRVFVYMAQTGALSRQKIMGDIFLQISCTTPASEEILSEQYKHAADLERRLLEFVPRRDVEIIDPGDAITPLDHLFRLAQIYRLSALLQIYLCFPDLVAKSRGLGTPPGNSQARQSSRPCRGFLVTLAVNILNVIATIPQESRVNLFLTLPLLIAGSTLQCDRIPARSTGCSEKPEPILCGSVRTIESELMTSSTADYMIQHWRSFTRSRLEVLYDFIGLGPITRASLILESVWKRADTDTVGMTCEPSESLEMVHWMKIMMESHLESIFG